MYNLHAFLSGADDDDVAHYLTEYPTLHDLAAAHQQQAENLLNREAPIIETQATMLFDRHEDQLIAILAILTRTDDREDTFEIATYVQS